VKGGLVRLLGHLAGRLPDRWLGPLARALAWLAFSLLRLRRRVALENLSRSLGLAEREARALARSVYWHLALGALELPRTHRITTARAMEILGPEGLSRLRSLLAVGRGVLVLSAHLGNWDLLACATALAGFPVSVVTRRIKNTALDRYWMEQRARCGVRLLEARGSAAKIVAALRRNEVVAFVLDQHEPGGEPVPFFGRHAATSTALARIALATRAPVLPAFLLRGERPGTFRLLLKDACMSSTPPHPRSEAAVLTAIFTKILEQAIREFPEQWLWLHRRWKIPAEAGSSIP
jgi:Kdo2-lipid IVA lauroyltransferase/acyltransferase